MSDDEAQYRAYEAVPPGPTAAEMRYRERRERIATAALQGLLASPATNNWRDSETISAVIELTDGLLAALDAQPSERGRP